MDTPTPSENSLPKEKPVVITSSGNKKDIFKFSFVNPKLLGAMTVLLLIIGGVGTGVYLVQKPQQTTSQASLTPVTINLQPSNVKTEVAAEFAVDVFAIAGENQITGADLTFKYDPEVLTLKSITPKQFLPKILTPPKIASGSASISLGTEGAGAKGNGILAGLLFNVNPNASPSSTTITFDTTTSKINILNFDSSSIAQSFGKTEVTILPATKPSLAPSPSFSTPSAIPSLKTPANTPSPSAPAYDINGDGVINNFDYLMINRQP